MIRFVSWTSLLLWLWLYAVQAVAAPRSGEEFRRHYDEALRLYEQGQYQSAIDEFQTAYKIKQLPRLLYNLGRAHFQLGHAQEALDLFQQFLRLEPHPPPDVLAKTQDNMAQAQAMLDAMERMKAAPPAPAPVPAGTAPPPVALPPPSPPIKLPGKAGAIMLNARVGAAVPLPVGLASGSQLPTELATGLEVGFALNASRSVYLMIPLQVQIEMLYGSVSAVFFMLPVGVQVDIPIRSAPGLFLYPRISAGYGVGTFFNSTTPTTSFGLALPEFGIKYVIKRRVNLGLEAFSLPILFTAANALVFYRAVFHVGVNL